MSIFATADKMLDTSRKLTVEMVMAIRRGGEAAFEELRREWHRQAHDVFGTKAEHLANAIWNIAEDRARSLKGVIRCRQCQRRNRVLLAKPKASCGECKGPLLFEDVVTGKGIE